MRYPQYVSDIIERLEANGEEAYIVGGSVRDMILGIEPHDFDITTSALPDDIMRIFSDYRTIPTGLKHGTVTVISEGEPIEVTTFRVDGEYKDSRHPESVSFTSRVEEDLARRDFTVNAMAYSHKRGIIDPFFGAEDIKKKVIRAVGDPTKRFSEDALRIMRAFRFSAQLGFRIDGDTLSAATALKDKLSNIARERISNEFLRLICSNEPSRALFMMRDAGIMPYILGEYVPSERVIDALSAASDGQRVRLGLLLCECAPEQRRAILSNLRLSTKLSSNVFTISARLGEALSGDEIRARRFIASCGELTEDVLIAANALGVMDRDFELLVRKNLAGNICTNYGDLAINGGDLITLGIKGKDIGRALDALLGLVIDSPELNTREDLLFLAKQKINNTENK